ncbi:hypothetical protein F4776DRAFT_612235 [Hypoxylon sp. NC0597]|nr:hypothetical protein F4776DRAFT_612235 [Hypoxylon sp. NC0597]
MEEMTEHCRTCHFFCEPCNLGFPTRERKNEHCTEKHFMCRKCDKIFPGREDLLRHFDRPNEWARGVRHGFCHSCEFDYHTQESLRSHYAASPMHLYCYACDLHFPTPAHLRVHFLELRDEEHHYCKTCNEAFETDERLHAHVMQSVVEHFYCTSCFTGFPGAQALSDHKEGHPLHFYCRQCDKEWDDEEFLRLHMARVFCRYELPHHDHCSLAHTPALYLFWPGGRPMPVKLFLTIPKGAWLEAASCCGN